jgi:hypothetical protein
MKKSEILRKFLKTNPEKFRKEFGDDPENSGHFEGSVPELPEGYWAHSGKFQKISANIRGFLGRGPTGASQLTSSCGIPVGLAF